METGAGGRCWPLERGNTGTTMRTGQGAGPGWALDHVVAYDIRSQMETACPVIEAMTSGAS
jgi:hypothetical protein